MTNLYNIQPHKLYARKRIVITTIQHRPILYGKPIVRIIKHIGTDHVVTCDDELNGYECIVFLAIRVNCRLQKTCRRRVKDETAVSRILVNTVLNASKRLCPSTIVLVPRATQEDTVIKVWPLDYLNFKCMRG